MPYNPLVGILLFVLLLVSLFLASAWIQAGKRPSENNLKTAATFTGWAFGFIAVACGLLLMTILPTD